MVKENAKYRKNHPSPPSQNKNNTASQRRLQDKKQKDK
jgi:hypothetical protein